MILILEESSVFSPVLTTVNPGIQADLQTSTRKKDTTKSTSWMVTGGGVTNGRPVIEPLIVTYWVHSQQVWAVLFGFCTIT